MNGETHVWELLRPEVRRFAVAMEERLRINDHTVSSNDVSKQTALECLLVQIMALYTECCELYSISAQEIQARATTVRRAGDPANFAVFIGDGVALSWDTDQTDWLRSKTLRAYYGKLTGD